MEKRCHHVCRRVLFLIIILCRFQCEDQGKKQTFECQLYRLLQAHWNKCDADNYLIGNCSVTEHHKVYRAEAGIKIIEGNLPHKSVETNLQVAQIVPIGIPIVC